MSLLALHNEDDPVAFGKDGPRTAAELLVDAARIAHQLPEASNDSQILLVFRHDRYAMAASLLGAWGAGHGVALPPNTRRESIWKIADRPETATILHDTEAGQGLAIPALLAQDTSEPGFTGVTLPEREHILTVYTSGTTLEPQGFPKSATQIIGEAVALAKTFELTSPTRVVGTVPPGHIYGLLFTVLVPLVSRGAFMRETLLHAEAIAAKVRQHEADILVTVPAHLRSFKTVAPDALGSLSQVFCSTAVLGEETARVFEARHHKQITEVFGSTETGGIAWRKRSIDSAWRPLPGVVLDVDTEGHLLVDSPFVDRGVPRPYRTQDLAELRSDQTFVHKGRADGVIKVGGLRVSLPAMEAAIRQLDRVEDAAVLAIPGGGGARGHQILAAVVAEAWTGPQLREALSRLFDHSCLPRRFALVDKLPREDNGKLQRGRLLSLFGLALDGAALVWEVAWGDTEAGRDGDVHRHQTEVTIPEHFGWFEGHFPGYPILPAAVQLRDLVVPSIRKARPDLGDVRQMTRLKFLRRIKPGDTLTVSLRWKEDQDTLEFSLIRAEQICSSGRIALGTANG